MLIPMSYMKSPNNYYVIHQQYHKHYLLRETSVFFSKGIVNTLWQMTYCRIGNDDFVRSCISWMKHKAEILMLMVMDGTVLPSVRNYLPGFF